MLHLFIFVFTLSQCTKIKKDCIWKPFVIFKVHMVVIAKNQKYSKKVVVEFSPSKGWQDNYTWCNWQNRVQQKQTILNYYTWTISKHIFHKKAKIYYFKKIL